MPPVATMLVRVLVSLDESIFATGGVYPAAPTAISSFVSVRSESGEWLLLRPAEIEIVWPARALMEIANG